MELKNLSQVTALGMALTLAAAQAAPPAALPVTQQVIGTAVSSGSFLMNDRVMPGSGSIQNGAAISTNAAGSTLHLSGGVRLDLSPNSRGRVYQDRLVLEAGEAQLEGAYRLDTNELRVSPSAGARSAVSYESDGRLKVSALSGAVQVSHASGLLLAQVMPGRSVLLSPKVANGPANAMSLMGTVEKRDNGLFLMDETAGITVRLQGKELEKYVGKKVRIGGKVDEQAPRMEGIAATVMVDRVQPVGSAAKKKTAAGAAAGGAAAATGGIGTTAIVVGSVAVAGAVTGTSVAVSRSGRSSEGSTPFRPTTISQ